MIKGAQTTVRVDGAALAAIALEIGGSDPAKVDAVLTTAREHRWRQATSAAVAGIWSRESAVALFGGPN